MKSWMRRVLCIGLIAIFLGGCSSNQHQEGAQPTEERPATLRMMMYSHASWPYDEGWPILDWIEEETGLRIEGIPPNGTFKDTVALAIVSGDIPDLIHFTSYEDAIYYGQQGALLDLTKHLDQMPNLKSFWDEHPELLERSQDPSGAVYITFNEGLETGGQRVWMYREDILDKHDLQMPTTWDELYEVAKQLKQRYPDSYPFSFRGRLDQLFTFAPSFDTWYEIYSHPGTREVRFGPIEDSYKAMLIALHQMYEEELLPPDFLSADTKNWVDLITSGGSFITADYIGRIEYLNSRMETKSMVFMPPPAGWSGGKGAVPNGEYSMSGFAILANSPHKEAAMRYLDFLYSAEGRDLVSWGKGETSLLESDQIRRFNPALFADGNNSFDQLRNQTGIGTNGFYGWFDSDAYIATVPEEESYVYREAGKYVYSDPILTPAFSEEEHEILIRTLEQIRKVKQENEAKFIIGERDFDEWEAYVNEINHLGLPQLLEAHKKAWK